MIGLLCVLPFSSVVLILNLILFVPCLRVCSKVPEPSVSNTSSMLTTELATVVIVTSVLALVVVSSISAFDVKVQYD